MVQALMGQSSATHQLFCKSASAAGRAGLHTREPLRSRVLLNRKVVQILQVAKENSRWRASGMSAAALLFWKEVCHGYMKHL